MSVTNHHADWPWCKARHCWHSIDTHFETGAGRMSLSLLLINVAFTSFINICIQSPLRLLKMPHQQSLRRCWLWFSGWGRERISRLVDYTGGQFVRKEQWHTKVNILRLAVGCLNVSINRPTRNPNQCLEPAGLGKPGKSHRWTGVGMGLAHHKVVGRVFR